MKLILIVVAILLALTVSQLNRSTQNRLPRDQADENFKYVLEQVMDFAEPTIQRWFNENDQDEITVDEEPTTEEPTTEEPTTEEPTTEEPSTEEPSTEEPSTEQPSTEQPSTEEPSTAAPEPEKKNYGTEEPSAPTEEATTSAPTEEATTAAPTEEATEEATTEEPSAPSTEEPSTAAPTEEATTSAPTEEATTSAPTEEPSAPSTEEPSAPHNKRGRSFKPNKPTEEPKTPRPIGCTNLSKCGIRELATFIQTGKWPVKRDENDEYYKSYQQVNFPAGLRVVFIDALGNVIYDTDPSNPEVITNYNTAPEVIRAIKSKESGFASRVKAGVFTYHNARIFRSDDRPSFHITVRISLTESK